MGGTVTVSSTSKHMADSQTLPGSPLTAPSQPGVGSSGDQTQPVAVAATAQAVAAPAIVPANGSSPPAVTTPAPAALASPAVAVAPVAPQPVPVAAPQGVVPVQPAAVQPAPVAAAPVAVAPQAAAPIPAAVAAVRQGLDEAGAYCGRGIVGVDAPNEHGELVSS